MPSRRVLCCDVHTATLVFAFIYLFDSLVRLVSIVLTTSRKKYLNSCSISEPWSQQTMNITTRTLVMMGMLSSTVMVFFSKRKAPRLVLPFVLVMSAELVSSFLSLFDNVWSLPGLPNYRYLLHCFKSTPGLGEVSDIDVGQFTMIYSVLYMLDLLLKMFALQVSVRCYYMLKEDSAAAMDAEQGKTVTVKLPSYEECLKMKQEKPPKYNQA